MSSTGEPRRILELVQPEPIVERERRRDAAVSEPDGRQRRFFCVTDADATFGQDGRPAPVPLVDTGPEDAAGEGGTRFVCSGLRLSLQTGWSFHPSIRKNLPPNFFLPGSSAAICSVFSRVREGRSRTGC